MTYTIPIRKTVSRYGLGVLTAVGIALATPYARATEIDPGPAVPGASDAITNGSTVGLNATGPTVTAMFIGYSAADEDTLSLPGWTPGGVVFDNMSTPLGATATLGGLTAGESLPFTLTNVSAGLTYVMDTAYTNTRPRVQPGLSLCSRTYPVTQALSWKAPSQSCTALKSGRRTDTERRHALKG